MAALPISIPALTPAGGQGHQFVMYADCCSGIPGAPHESTFASVNRIVRRLSPPPEFICFPGDEIVGLTYDEAELRRQWAYWLDHEMAWLDRQAVPLYHTTGNHTAYDPISEAVFRDILSHLPRNGPPGQEGLSYFVRRGDLLLIFANTLWQSEGRVETAWLDWTLTAHGDAAYKLVFGHHPVFADNGFSGPFQRTVEPESGQAFWNILVRHGVLAYVCSHMLAFDVQVHDGVLQILTAGAGTAHLMPPDVEYLHCIQAALDSAGLRYQVLDTGGQVREWLAWPPHLPPSGEWLPLPHADPVLSVPGWRVPDRHCLVAWNFSGTCAESGGPSQALLSGRGADKALSPIWIGLTGSEQRLTVYLSPGPGRSPHHWYGPTLPPGRPFQIQVALHSGMGPGGLLWRWDDAQPWNSLIGASAWGTDRLDLPERWNFGHDQMGSQHRPFRGTGLEVTCCSQVLPRG